MKNLLTILTGMLILTLTQPALAGWDKLAKEKIEQLEAAQKKAQTDGESIAKATAILSGYNSTNNQYYNGLPVIVKEVKAIIEKNESFRDDELVDINNQIEAFYDDYGASNLKELESNIGEHLNPKEWTGMQSPMPFSAYQYQQNLETFEVFEKEAQDAMAGAVANEKDEAARSVIVTSDFPQHNYEGSDIEQLQSEVRAALINLRSA